jgi:hypothetical protein
MKEINRDIQNTFSKLSPELRQALWDLATQWILRRQYPPTAPGQRPIMWEFEADKYYDPDKQDRWVQMARTFVFPPKPPPCPGLTLDYEQVFHPYWRS